MKYKDALKSVYSLMSLDPLTRFIGYNLKFGSKHYRILDEIDQSKIIETPVAENLMVGMAIGLSFERYRPIVIFERQDFMLNAMDAMLNHLDKIEKMSDGIFKPKVIIKATVGCNKPFDSGLQHTQDYTEAMKLMFKNIKVISLMTSQDIIYYYTKYWKNEKSVILVDYKDLYDQNFS